MLPHRLLVSNPLLVQGSRERVRSPTSNVRCRQGRGRGEDPSLPRLGAYSAACSTDAARAGPERHCRGRRGGAGGRRAGGGGGRAGGAGETRGGIRARLPGTEGEPGGPGAESRRLGSPREARSEGPSVLL